LNGLLTDFANMAGEGSFDDKAYDEKMAEL
jgi:hypothetical protein